MISFAIQNCYERMIKMKLIIYNNELSDIVRIGLYDKNGKWIKWIGKKQLDNYIDKVESVENKII